MLYVRAVFVRCCLQQINTALRAQHLNCASHRVGRSMTDGDGDGVVVCVEMPIIEQLIAYDRHVCWCAEMYPQFWIAHICGAGSFVLWATSSKRQRSDDVSERTRLRTNQTIIILFDSNVAAHALDITTALPRQCRLPGVVGAGLVCWRNDNKTSIECVRVCVCFSQSVQSTAGADFNCIACAPSTELRHP